MIIEDGVGFTEAFVTAVRSHTPRPGLFSAGTRRERPGLRNQNDPMKRTAGSGVV